jgi:hypothetical protein
MSEADVELGPVDYGVRPRQGKPPLARGVHRRSLDVRLIEGPGPPPDQATNPAFHRIGAIAVIAGLLLAVIIPLWVNSDRINKTTIRQNAVQAVAEQWASEAGWFVAGVATKGDQVLVEATGPSPAHSLTRLRNDLNAAGLTGLDVRTHLTVYGYQPLPQ